MAKVIKRRSARGGDVMLMQGGGASLSSHLKRCEKRISFLNSREMLDIARQFFEGVAFLHENGVQHNDLKMDHVTMNDAGRVYIIDFSLATRNSSKESRVKDTKFDGDFIGTKGWTAPEVGRGKRYSAKRADVWAAGKVMRKFCEELVRIPGNEFVGGDVELLMGICERLMVKEPEERPRELESIVKEIEDYVSSNPTDAFGG